ncbi:MAG: AMMECR1 domain-containing protein, partial [Bacteroidota bacterium]|nr:AMMECR1 domain-containing protein [Bacteroidota bacterium]
MKQRKSTFGGFHAMEQELSTGQGNAIIAAAEAAVRAAVNAPREEKSVPREPDAAEPDAAEPDAAEPDVTFPGLEVSGLFVTVRVGGRLRGCIGFLEPLSTFAATLREAARRAATEDARFPTVEAGELDEMTVDVTLLGPLLPLSDAMDFRIGDHGLVIEAHGR